MGSWQRSSQSDRLEGIPMMDRGLFRKTAEHHLCQAAWGSRDLRCHGANRDAGGTVEREAINAGRDRRIGDRGETVLGGKRESGAIAGSEQIILALVAAAPHRPDRMNHMFRPELIAARDL